MERGSTCAEIAAGFGIPPLAAGGIGALCAAFPTLEGKAVALYNYLRSH